MLGRTGHECWVGTLARRREMIQRVSLRGVDRHTAALFKERPKPIQSRRIALRGRKPMLLQEIGGGGLAGIRAAERRKNSKGRQARKHRSVKQGMPHRICGIIEVRRFMRHCATARVAILRRGK